MHLGAAVRAGEWATWRSRDPAPAAGGAEAGPVGKSCHYITTVVFRCCFPCARVSHVAVTWSGACSRRCRRWPRGQVMSFNNYWLMYSGAAVRAGERATWRSRDPAPAAGGAEAGDARQSWRHAHHHGAHGRVPAQQGRTQPQQHAQQGLAQPSRHRSASQVCVLFCVSIKVADSYSLDTGTDPDLPKWCRSDRIWIPTTLTFSILNCQENCDFVLKKMF